MTSARNLRGKELVKSLLLMFLLLFMVSRFAIAQAQAEDTVPSGVHVEKQIKAAYLYKFASYIEWPEGTFIDVDAPLVIGVTGSDDMGDELQRIVAGRTANGRSIVVRKLRPKDSIAGIHILFIGALEKTHLVEMLNAVKGQPVLTVSETEQAHALGSMINFRVAQEKLRFEVALKPVEYSRLKISARMLSVAFKVAQGTS